MYRALEHLRVAVPGGTASIAPGEPVPGFEDWAPWTQHVMLDEKKLRWAPEGITEGEIRRARKLTPYERQYVEREAIKVPEQPHPVETFKGHTEEELDGALETPPIATPVLGVDEAASDDEPGLTCDVCQQTGFKSATGLKIHRNKAHRGV